MSENYVFDDHLLKAMDEDVFVPAPVPKVVLKGAAIVVIEMGDGTTELVIFRPTSDTLRIVNGMKDVSIDLKIEDVNGLFMPPRPQFIVGSIYEPSNNTMRVTTEDQE